VARGVHVEVAVDVEQPAAIVEGGIQTGHRPDGDGAVAAQDEQATVVGHHPRDAIGQLPGRRHDLTDVLGEPVVTVGRPHLNGEIPGVAHVDAHSPQCPDESRVAESARRPVLTCRVTPGTAGHPDHHQWTHAATLESRRS
jgi:hypothetical protein